MQPEPRLLLFGTDSLDYVTTWLAAVRLGAIPVVVSDLYKPRELLYFLADTGVRTLFIDSEQVSKLIEIAGELPSSVKTILVRGDVTPDIAGHFQHQSVVDLHGSFPPAPPKPAHRVSSMRMTSPTCSIPAAPPAPPRALPISPTISFWFPSATAGSGNIAAADVVFATSKKYFTHGLGRASDPALLGRDRGAGSPAADAGRRTGRRCASSEVTKFITVPTVLKNVIER